MTTVRTLLAVVGGGNMGSALVAGIIASGTLSADDIVVVEASEERRAILGDLLPGVTVAESVVPVESAIIAVKPPVVAEVARIVAAAGADRIVSIAAGVTSATIRKAGPVTKADAMKRGATMASFQKGRLPSPV